MTLQQAIEEIRRGGVVAFPTETVYGLGANAWNPMAIRSIFEIKGRPADNPLIIHLAGGNQVIEFTPSVPEPVMKLIETCWPGPLTLIFRKRQEVLDAVTAGLPTVALRVPDHPIARELIRQTGPLAAPSANRSGRPSPTTADHIRADFGDTLPILDGGPADIGLESTVLDVTTVPWRILRPGRYTTQELSEIAEIPIIEIPPVSDKPASPGVKYSHYQPDARVSWLMPDQLPEPESTLLITHTGAIEGFPHHIHFSGDYRKFAHQLYDLFRKADMEGLEQIAIEPLPSPETHGLVPALLNRITKAVGETD